jgi:hypothetical protein
VLVHHADPGLDRVARVAEATLATVHPDRALVRSLHAVEDLHQRGLAGAVLTDERVHGAGANAQVHVAVGDDAGKRLVTPVSSTATAWSPVELLAAPGLSDG